MFNVRCFPNFPAFAINCAAKNATRQADAQITGSVAGARPLKRAIQEHLLDPLATKLLAGEFKPGDRIKVGAKNGELVFGKR